MVWCELDSLAPPVKTGPEFGVQATHGDEEILQTKGTQSLGSWHFTRVAGEGAVPRRGTGLPLPLPFPEPLCHALLYLLNIHSSVTC